MKKFLLFVIPAILLSACGKHETYVVGETAVCTGLEETSPEKVFCKDLDGNAISGLVIQKYENGNIWREMTIKMGQENGIEKEYYENGNMKVYANIKNGNAIGTSKLYHENGKLHMIIKWNGEDAEIVEIHDENGNLLKPSEN